MSRELKARRLPTFPMYEIFMEGGGNIPKDLSGLYTSERNALDAIKLSQAKVQNKVSKRGKSTS